MDNKAFATKIKGIIIDAIERAELMLINKDVIKKHELEKMSASILLYKIVIEESAERLAVQVSDYIETQILLFMKKVTDQIAKFLASVIKIITLIVFGIFVLLFISIALALWIGNTLDNTPLGFLLIGFLYIILGTITYKYGKQKLHMTLQDMFTDNLTKQGK